LEYKVGINVNITKDNDSIKPGINITNYEKIERFDGRYKQTKIFE